MALTPYHIGNLLSFREVALLLAGVNPRKHPNFSNDDDIKIREWKEKLVVAILEGSIGMVGNPWAVDRAGKESDVTDTWLKNNYRFGSYDLFFDIKKSEVYRWLKDNKVSDEDIPEALRLSPEDEDGRPTTRNNDLKIANEELRASEVLGLLAEALSQQHPEYASAGRPNRSAIVSIMGVVVEGYEKPKDRNVDPLDLHGFGKTTIDEILKAAIAEWERRKKSRQS